MAMDALMANLQAMPHLNAGSRGRVTDVRAGELVS
jgi:hypothetical protein